MIAAAGALPRPGSLVGPTPSRSSPSCRVPGHAGVATGGSMEEWGRRFCHATLSSRILPLPPLRRPPLSRARSSRLRARAKSRREVWRHFEGLRRTLNHLYSDHLPSTTSPGGLRPLLLGEFSDAQRASVRNLLAEVKVLSGVRRQFAATGASPLSHVLKSDFTDYSSKKPEVYVDFQADQIAEPSDPVRTVDMLKELPAAMSELYQNEEEVLRGR
ncbi:hypothetical protein N9L68_01725 [bacterium]|nr:hypothetical protein [bacterium]